MPGTINVSVLDFLDLPSTPSSSVFFKVSMGKREYQTLDKGEFSFPVKSLREKLILEVLDDFGSKLCQTVVEAILVVQKGQWDDYFSLDDRGRVHMRLQFVLSDEDRSKIQKMRETALQKKRRQLLITNPESAKTIRADDGARNNDIAVGILSQRNDGGETAKTGPLSGSRSFSNTQPSVSDENKDGHAVSKQQANSIEDRTKEAINPSTALDAAEVVKTRVFFENQEAKKQSIETSSGNLNFKLSSFTRKGKLFDTKTDDEDGTAAKGQVQRTPSSVMKMISAFESNSAQDTKSRNKPPPLRSPILKLGFENPSHDMIADEIIVMATKKLTEMSSEIVVSPSFFSELRQKVTAKKRQISSDIVEIITIAPERGLSEATADELTEIPLEDETYYSAADRFEATPSDMITDGMTSHEDNIKVLQDETRDNVHLEDKELQNDDMTSHEDVKVPEVETSSSNFDIEDKESQNTDAQFFEDNKKFLTVEKDKFDGMQGSDRKDQMEISNEEYKSSISAEHTHLETMDGTDPVNDRTATVYGEFPDDQPVKQLVADDLHSDSRRSGSIVIKVNREKEVQLEDSQHVKMGTISTQKAEPIKSLAEWPPSGEPPSSWVFPDEPRVSCITPSSMELINSIGGCNVDANIYAGEHIMHDARKPLQEKKLVDEPSRSPSAEDSESGGGGNPNGQFAQAIKIAIMVAFGALVFFSRQRNHR